MLRIKKVKICGIGGINILEISLRDGINIICGPNGVGKTTILESISAPFISSMTGIENLKRNSLVEHGIIDISIEVDSQEKNKTLIVKEFEPRNKNVGASWYELYREVIFFKTHRDINYISLDSIKTDKINNDYSLSEEQANTGVKSENIKNWFIHRHLWSKHENELTDAQKQNFNLAKSCFEMLDNNISFYKVNPRTNDIILKTQSGEIYYEYLSSGYKAVLHLLLGFIKEIEYRFGDNNMLAKDFGGVILIDEIDLHLHPQWQYKVLNCIKLVFPKAQVIATTHSPHVLQSCKSDEIISLTKSDDNTIKIKELQNMKYGLQGWSVEEILQDIMELDTVQSKLYNDIMDKFEIAIDEDDYIEAKRNYEILEQMLHPQNSMLKLLKIQMAGMKE